MEFKYELHCHSSNCSACARTDSRDMVHKYKEAGYAGFVLTDHFIFGNSAVDKTLPWEERMQCYYDAYLAAKEEGDKIDFDVIFGIEHAYGHGKEFLCYGIDLDFLLNNPDIPNITVDEFVSRVHNYGGLIIQAHPYRERGYIDSSVLPRTDLIDGIEVYNAGNKPHENVAALQLLNDIGSIAVSGSDFHGWPDEPANRAGIASGVRIKNSTDLINVLKSGNYKLIVNTQIVDDLEEKIF